MGFVCGERIAHAGLWSSSAAQVRRRLPPCNVHRYDLQCPLDVETGQAGWILSLALETPPKRRMSAERWFLHDHKPDPLQVPHDALRGNGGHVFGGVVFSLAILKPEREGNRLGEAASIGGRQIVGRVARDPGLVAHERIEGPSRW